MKDVCACVCSFFFVFDEGNRTARITFGFSRGQTEMRGHAARTGQGTVFEKLEEKENFD